MKEASLSNHVRPVRNARLKRGSCISSTDFDFYCPCVEHVTCVGPDLGKIFNSELLCLFHGWLNNQLIYLNVNMNLRDHFDHLRRIFCWAGLAKWSITGSAEPCTGTHRVNQSMAPKYLAEVPWIQTSKFQRGPFSVSMWVKCSWCASNLCGLLTLSGWTNNHPMSKCLQNIPTKLLTRTCLNAHSSKNP